MKFILFGLLLLQSQCAFANSDMAIYRGGYALGAAAQLSLGVVTGIGAIMTGAISGACVYFACKNPKNQQTDKPSDVTGHEPRDYRPLYLSRAIYFGALTYAFGFVTRILLKGCRSNLRNAWA